MTEVAVGWLAAREPVGPVICGATTPEQVRDNAAAGRWRPGPEELAEIDEICPPTHG